MKDVIPNSVNKLHEKFKNKGKDLFLVGGAVRDFIKGDTPKDFDLATNAMPNEVIEILKGTYRSNEQGKSFGVVVAYTEDEPNGMEIATFRSDISKGRNPKVKLGVTIEEDVNRRDLTFNALFYDINKGEIIDLVGGVDDLKNGITRTVGDPMERFDEDALRILRCFRFNSRYGFKLSDDLVESLHKRNFLSNIDPDTGLMVRISQERIWDEITKSFTQVKDFVSYLNLFTRFNMWGEVFPNTIINTNNIISSNNLSIVLASIMDLSIFKKESIALKNLVQKLKIDNKTASEIVFLNTILDLNENSVFDIYKKRNQLGISDELLSEWFSKNGILDNPIFKEFISYKPTTSGDKLISLGFSGKEIGLEMKKIETEKFKNKLNK